MNKPPKYTSTLPSKADILAFIARHPGKVGTREIARAFGLKNEMRAELKRMLRDLADEGAVERKRQETASARGACLHRARRHHRRATATAN